MVRMTDKALSGDVAAWEWFMVCREMMERVCGPVAKRLQCGCCDRYFSPRRKPELVLVTRRALSLPGAREPGLVSAVCGICAGNGPGHEDAIHARLAENLREVLPGYHHMAASALIVARRNHAACGRDRKIVLRPLTRAVCEAAVAARLGSLGK
jgi:hypothetical protein